jgi:hypothetical protein
VFASLFSCQRTVLPIPSGRPSNFLADNKKPGVERRVPSPQDSEETRSSNGSIRYSYLTSLRNDSYGAPMAGLQTPVKRNCLQPIQEYRDET